MSSKKRLTEAELELALADLGVGQQTADIAKGVLVEGKPQADFVKSLSLTRGAVSQAVNRVWAAHKEQVPQGFERVTVVLPEHQAFIVKKWAQDSARRTRKNEQSSVEHPQ